MEMLRSSEVADVQWATGNISIPYTANSENWVSPVYPQISSDPCNILKRCPPKSPKTTPDFLEAAFEDPRKSSPVSNSQVTSPRQHEKPTRLKGLLGVTFPVAQ